MKQRFENKRGTKAVMYKQMNLKLRVHNVYRPTKHIDERKRTMFTKFRLSSHNMKVETGMVVNCE